MYNFNIRIVYSSMKNRLKRKDAAMNGINSISGLNNVPVDYRPAPNAAARILYFCVSSPFGWMTWRKNFVKRGKA